jgi:hypothetical protein
VSASPDTRARRAQIRRFWKESPPQTKTPVDPAHIPSLKLYIFGTRTSNPGAIRFEEFRLVHLGEFLGLIPVGKLEGHFLKNHITGFVRVKNKPEGRERQTLSGE